MSSSEGTFMSPRPSPSEDYNEETINLFRDAYKCTEEDLQFKFTDDQLKELCLKHKCRVMASRWNIVFEYNLWLTKDGRFKDRSARYARGMVTKAVNRHKTRIAYDEETIQKTLGEEFLFRKKDSILSLRMWERDRKEKERKELEHRDEEEASIDISISCTNGEGSDQHDDLPGNIDEGGAMNNLIKKAPSCESINSVLFDSEEAESQYLSGDYNEDSHNPADAVNVAPAVMSADPIDGDEIEIEIMSMDLSGDYNEDSHNPVEVGDEIEIEIMSMDLYDDYNEDSHNPVEAVNVAPAVMSTDPIDGDENEITSMNLSGDYNEDSHNPVEAVNVAPAVMSTDPIDGDEIEKEIQFMNDEIINMFDLNTASMSTYNTQTQTQSQDVSSDDFNKDKIPLTSTQKESDEYESGGKI